MEDQGVVLGAALGLKYFGNGIFIQAVGSQAVDSLRGDGHQAPIANDRGGNFWGVGGVCV